MVFDFSDREKGRREISNKTERGERLFLQEGCGRHGVVGHGAAMEAAIAKSMMREGIPMPRMT
jgi:hypothetical protein